MRVNVSAQVYQAIAQASQDQTIDTLEFAKITDSMVADGQLSQDELAVLQTLKQGAQRTLIVSFEQNTLTLNPRQLTLPDFALNAEALDLAFLDALAGLSPDELSLWLTEVVSQSPENQEKIRQAHARALQASKDQDPQLTDRLNQLGHRLQELVDRSAAPEVLARYSGRDAAGIARQFTERVSTAARDSAAARQQEIQALVSDLRLMTQQGDPDLKSRLYDALAQSLSVQVPDYRGRPDTLVPWTELVTAVESLTGPGAAEVKARLIHLLQTQPPPPHTGEDLSVPVATLLSSEPAAVMDRLTIIIGPAALEQTFETLARHYARQDPEALAALMGKWMGRVAEDYATVVTAVPRDEERMKSMGMNLGRLLHATDQAIDVMAADKQSAIDRGALIVKVFTLGFNKVPGIKSALEKGVGFSKKQEEKALAAWQNNLQNGFRNALNHVMRSRAPALPSGHPRTQAFERQLRDFDTHVTLGYAHQRHVK